MRILISFVFIASEQPNGCTARPPDMQTTYLEGGARKRPERHCARRVRPPSTTTRKDRAMLLTRTATRVLLLLAFAAPPVAAARPDAAAAASPGPRTDGCSAGGSASHADDAARAIRACVTARDRFAELFGSDSLPAIHVVLHDEPGYEVASIGPIGIVYWPNTRALGSSVAGSAAMAAQWGEVLPHEVMHALTMARFFSGGGADGHGGYGTPLPDWFEEGIAIWGEPPESRQGRLRQARALPAARLDLSHILQGSHPVAGNAALMAPVPGAPPPRDEALRAFYPQSIAVLSFVFDAGGQAAVSELARRLLATSSSAAPLAGLPGLPLDATAVDAAWQRWLRRTAASP
jgi:hypothetical protein